MRSTGFFQLITFCAVFAFPLVLCAEGNPEMPANQYSLTLVFPDLKCKGGNVMIAVHSGGEGFPGGKPFAEKELICAGMEGQKVTLKLPAGRFAVAVFHDMNGNRELDRNMFRIPAEPFGFSNNPRVIAGPPDFNEAAFQLSGDMEIQIFLK